MNNFPIDDKHLHWTQDLSVGVSEIDDDHKKLFELFHEAWLLSQKQTDNASLSSLAAELIEYTQSHFKREEAIMAASAYPYCENHFAIHEQLIKQLTQQYYLLIKEQKSAKDFMLFLNDGFIEHIKETDQRITSYTAGHEENIARAIQKAGPLAIPQCCIIHLVDDDEDYLELLQAMTDAADLKSIAYPSGKQFLMASITDNDVVVLDLNMPEIDGIEVMRELADKNLRPTFILVSGFDERVLHSAKQLAESKQLRVAEILSKPIDTEDFIKVLTKVHGECKSRHIQKEPHKSLETSVINKTENKITVSELTRAIEKHELIVYLQPQVRFDDKKLTGAEVLVRWQHPVLGLVFPDQFIPLAEQHKMMTELTEAVILESIKAYKQLKAADINLSLSINLSAQNINDLALPEKLGTLLKSNDIAPEAFVLELTESEILTDTSAALDIFNRLRMKGFSLSIDDFGTGNSSLKKLYQTPFSELKIDQHFVSRIEKDDDATSIVRVCTLLAKEFKMHTVAEGVETQEVWDKLKALGCDYAQGYFIAKPMPVNLFIEFSRKHTSC